MASRVWLVGLLLAMAVVVIQSSAIDASQWGLSHVSIDDDGDLLYAKSSCNGLVGDCISEEDERMLGSESARRQLGDRRRYISYDALNRNNVPCNRRGNSYYNCRGNAQANPYNRGCSQITRCARALG